MRPLWSVLFAALFALAPAVSAQTARWQAEPALRNVRTLSASTDALWAGTDGGIYRYAPGTGEIERFTPVQGLSSVEVQSLVYDDAREAVWIGYRDGTLDRLDAASGAVQPFLDIAQADRFNARAVNRIEVEADSLLISTDFGVVVFDAVRDEVIDTYERFGTFPAGTSVGDALVAPLPDGRPGLWVGTREGIAYAPLSAPNLREPSAWTLDPDTLANVISLAAFDGTVFAGTRQTDDEDGGLYRRDADGQWGRVTSATRSFWDLFVQGDELAAVSVFQVILVGADGGTRSFGLNEVSLFQTGALGPEGDLWIGSSVDGLAAFPALGGLPAAAVDPERVVVPNGPVSNTVRDIDVAPGGDVWAGFEAPNSFINGFARFDGSTWTNFTTRNGALPDRGSVRVVHADQAGNVWFGTEGRGVYQYAPDGGVTLYTEDNSTLLPVDPDGGPYLVSKGVDTDAAGLLWVTNLSPRPLHVREPDGTWTVIERPASVPTSFSYDDLYIDSFGQKWITGFGDEGFLVLDTGADPLDPSDDQAAVVRGAGEVGTGLPDPKVEAIVEDRSGRIWIGTERGLATVFSPGSIFVGDPEQQVTWARTPDGALFLRDLRIFDIAVDPADRKWLASNSGLWLLNAEGNEVIANLTTDNAPLPSNIVLAVDVDDASGRVYLATEGGFYSYDGDAIAAVPTAEDLFIYPNPVRASGGVLPEIAIEGLVDDADVRVLTVDGQVVASFRTRGGSTRWNGRDQRTGEVVPSGVYIVAAAGQNGEGTSYGKIAVIR